MDTTTKTKLVAIIQDSYADAVTNAEVADLAAIDTAVAALDPDTSAEADILAARNMLKNLKIGSLDSVASDWTALEQEVGS